MHLLPADVCRCRCAIWVVARLLARRKVDGMTFPAPTSGLGLLQEMGVHTESDDRRSIFTEDGSDGGLSNGSGAKTTQEKVVPAGIRILDLL